MIYCPNCNTANRDNSRFCNECGASLKDAKRRCQVCGTMNAADQNTCSKCGAKLQIMADDEPEDAAEEEAPVAPRHPPAIPPTIPATAPPNAGLPDWLTAMQEPSRSSREEDDIIANAPTTALPAWMSDTEANQAASPTASASATPASTAEDESKSPAWLRDLRSRPLANEPEPAPKSETPLPPALQAAEDASSSSTEDLPSWLRGLRTGPAAAPAAESAAESPREQAAAPDWLSDLSSATASSEPVTSAVSPDIPVPVSPEPVIEPATSDDLPDWLKELAAGKSTQSAPPVPQVGDLSDVAVDELPQWLKPSAPSTTESPVAPAAAPPVPPPSSVAASGLAPAELPGWLTEIRSSARSIASEPIETSGLLAGVRGALPVESVFVTPHQYAELAPVHTSLPITGFAELHAPNPTPPAAGEKPQKPRRFKWPWQLMLSLALIGAIAASFLQLPIVSDARGTTVAAYQPSRDFFQTVDLYNSRDSKGIVLVAFDYTAGTRDELDMQARPVLRHLFENQQHIVTVSSLPEGGILAQDQLNARNPSNTPFAYPFRYGETHLNLGYISGGDAALRSLAQDQMGLGGTDYRDHRALSEWPILKNWMSFGDVELLVLFSDDAANVARWVEQVSMQAGRSHKPIVVGVSKAAETAVMPYYQSKQINGLLSGVHGACEYENDLIEPNVAVACASLDAQSYASVVLVAIIGLSLPAMLFLRKR